MSDFASSKYTAGQLNAVVKLLQKQGGPNGVERFIRGELVAAPPTRAWREEDGVIYFSVTSDGAMGERWIRRFRAMGCGIGEHVEAVLRSQDFRSTCGVTAEIAVLRGGFISADDARTTPNVRLWAAARGFTNPNPEVACLIREKFTDVEIEKMGLRYILTMHEPIVYSKEDHPYLLAAHRVGIGG